MTDDKDQTIIWLREKLKEEQERNVLLEAKTMEQEKQINFYKSLKPSDFSASGMMALLVPQDHIEDVS